MFSSFFHQKTALVGAGKFCVRFLTHFFRPDAAQTPDIIGVADRDPNAPGIALAKSLGIPTATDYHDFAWLGGLQVILEMSNDPTLADAIKAQMPDHIRVMDHYETRTLFDLLLVQEFRDQGLAKIRRENWDPEEIQKFLNITRKKKDG